MTTSFSGKTAIVTGASSGIGFEVATRLAAEDATVYAVARRTDRLQALVKDFPKNIIAVTQDVTMPLTELSKAVAGRRIDILVNNAGGALGRDAIQDCPPERWQGMIAKNLTSLIAVTQLVLPQMIAQGAGDILNVGSIAALQPYGNGSVYCAVKAGVASLTEAWQQDLLGKGIRVMAVHPGLVETEFSLMRFAGDAEKAKAVYAGLTPLCAADVAETMVWMLARPKHVNMSSVTLLPTAQASATQIWRQV